MATKHPSHRPSTQQHLNISEIRDDVVIMKDGTLRAVFLVSSINFALKSEEEQEALISAYVGFLNTLEFPLQVIIQSRQLNIDNYLGRLKEAEKVQPNELLRMQINDYRQFISELVDIGQIMTKQFYVVVSYDPLSNKRKGFFSRFKESFAAAAFVRLKEERFQQRKKDLISRSDQTIGQLQGLGVQAVLLDTQSLIELFYIVYNPELMDTEKMVPLDQLQVERQ
ncbi:MAG: hypothetical protein UX10_C0018G0018 [Candidatus Magasanikbacteria bacterium GW2011_GWA2_45_39]|uniref:TraC-like domain-containing protein n=1 Tax=Candidatus Magasanikbacteria bacterium GW2011_GWA2_45_39 TaxID=1619041 RepID=A0A0G1MFR8_9BACT|nr:MAG: hypothetical protein UX10_C0018G0018 [Candidatus Magasanikbacteria bacterium GW2011_GWA2_45_39]